MSAQKEITENILSSVKASLSYLTAAMGTESPTARQLRTIRLQFPRQSGHTTATIRLLEEYPCSIGVMCGPYRHTQYQRSHPTISDRLFSSQDLEGNKILTINQSFRTFLTLKGGMDFVIIDGPVSISEQDLDAIFCRFLPKLVVLLGDVTLRP